MASIPTGNISIDESISEDSEILLSFGGESRNQVKLYKRRWLVLFVFCLNSMTNAALFISFGSINDIVCKYYNIHPDTVDWTANAFLLIYFFLALPCAYFMSTWGMRPLMIIGASLNAMAAAFHYAGSGQDGFPLVMLGQICAAIAVGAILQVPARLAAVWFGEHERATATSFGVAMNIFGMAVGFLQPTHMVQASKDFKNVESHLEIFYISQLAASIVFLVMTYVFYEEEPPTAPTLSEALTQSQEYHVVPGFLVSLKVLARDKNFNIIAQSYGIYFGMFCCFSVLLNEMVTLEYAEGYEEYIGWMGFGGDIAAIFVTTGLGFFLDKYHYFRGIAIILNFSTMLAMTVYLVLLIRTNYFVPMFVSYVVLGGVGIPFFCTGLDQVAEMTFPVPEGTSSAIVLGLGNLYGFVFILFLGALIDKKQMEVAGIVMVGLYGLSSLLASISKVKLKRLDAEKKMKHRWEPGNIQSVGAGLPDIAGRVPDNGSHM